MKIVYCIPGVFASGGTERVVINKANYLVNQGYEVIIITTDQNGRAPFFALDKRVIHYDLGINYFLNAKRNPLYKIFYFVWNRILHKCKLRELLLTLKADVVVSMYMNEMSILPEINDGSKKILEFHFSRPFFKINRRSGMMGLMDMIQNKLDIAHISKYEKFIVLTEEDKENWAELTNVHVIYNASSIKGIHSSDEGDVIAVGRLTYQKGFDRLIDVWAKVHTDRKLRIYGDGELREVLNAKIKSMCLEDRISIEMPTRDILSVYSNASLLVMTSLYEGLPMVMIEAQSCGLPVISFDFPCGPKDVINDGIDGYIICNGDVEAMAEKITKLMNDDSIRIEMGKNAKKNSARFDVDYIMSQWCELFNDINVS